MEVAFKIPNGTMRVNADVFFREARIRKVRKMLKLFRESGPAPSQVEEIKDWLREQMQEEKGRQKQEILTYETQMDWLSELEEIYERMKNPCDAVFTLDREKLEHGRQKVLEYRRICRRHMQNIKTARKREEKYQASLEDVVRILEGGSDEGETEE